ncbi:MFS transporter [Timonella senegalensis]|uniref:MFS transporter n=1 Tax=Timonella senegalensis TaxID=1465825 RepID=UPI0002E64415|nr:MFS transporter [Timonella senegalensis]
MTTSATRNKSKIHYAWWILLAISIIVGCGKGVLMNTAGLFLPPVTEELGVGMGTLMLYFSVSAIVTLVFLPLGGKLMAKYDPRQIIIASIIFQGGSFALFGLMSSVWGWYLLAIPLAMGGTLLGVIVGPVLINTWFRKRNGLALGVLTATGGLMGAIAQPVVANIIAGSGWRTAYITVGLACIAIVIPIALVLLKRSPQAIGTQPFGSDEIEQAADAADAPAAAAAETVAPKREDGIEIGVARKSVPFYLILSFFFLITSISSFSMHIPKHVANLGFDTVFAGSVMSLYMIGVLVASLLLGYLVDALGVKMTAILTMAVAIVAIFMILFGGANTLIIKVAVAMFAVVGASITIIGPALVSALFGKRDYALVYSNASLGLGISSIVALPAYGFIYDITGSYTPVLWALVAMLALNIVCVLFAFKNQKKMVANGLWITEGGTEGGAESGEAAEAATVDA